MVHVPEFGGDPNSPENWILASYCSPFAGATYQPQRGYTRPSKGPTDEEHPYEQMVKRTKNRTPDPQDPLSGKQSYGMWFVPPDLENTVVIAFINGDVNQAIWMGCMFHQDSNRMVPGAAEGQGYDKNGKPLEHESPTIERDPSAGPPRSDLDKEPRREYGPLANGLKKQGLDSDNAYLGGGQRGQAKSTPHRESPSEVFGIMTPDGNHLVFDDGLFDEKTSRYNQGTNRTHELIRLRTKSGVQILLHETEGFIYMITKDGKSWIELSNDGNVDVYSAKTVNFHAYSGDINLKAGGNINIQAGMNINMAAGCDMYTTVLGDQHHSVRGDRMISITGSDSAQIGGTSVIESVGEMAIHAGGEIRIDSDSQMHLNSGRSLTVTLPQDPKTYTVPAHPGPPEDGRYVPGEDYPDGTNINSRVPQHEPWTGRSPSASPTPASTVKATELAVSPRNDEPDSPVVGSEPSRATANTPTPVINSGGKPNQANISTRGVGSVGPLDSNDTNELVRAIAYTESRGRLNEENSLGFLGRYQFGAPALVDAGYVDRQKWEAAGKPDRGPMMKKFLNNESNWTLTGGKKEFLRNEDVQNQAMGKLMRQNYNSMVKTGAISENSSKQEVGAALYGAHLGGAGGSARVLRGGADASDAFGTSISKYQDLGRRVFA